MLKFLTNKINLRLTRRIIRGYNVLNKAGKIKNISQLNEELTSTECIKINDFTTNMFSLGCSRNELVVRQFLISKIVGIRLSKTLLFCTGSKIKIIYPIPPLWRPIFKNYGFELSNFLTKVIWNIFVVYMFIRGITAIPQSIYKIIFTNRNTSKDHFKFVYFFNLNLSNIPKSSKDESSRNIINWYINSEIKEREIDSVFHSAKNVNKVKIKNINVQYTDNFLPLNLDTKSIIMIILWVPKSMLMIINDILRGNWWNPIMFNETFLYKVFSFAKRENIAKGYFFSNSNYIYRPMWTYKAEEEGSKIYLYFYSTNVEGFKNYNKKENYSAYGYKSMSWSNYLVWNKYQKNFIGRNANFKYKTSIVGPISFSDNGINFKNDSEKIIGVFDVQPVYEFYYKSIAPAFNYYTAENVCNFLKHIYEICDEKGLKIVFKSKGKRGVTSKVTHIKYRNYIESLSKCKNFKILDPSISAERIIESCSAVISMPFTATSVYSKHLKIKTAFYDPTGDISANHSSAHGVKVLNKKSELKKWINELI